MIEKSPPKTTVAVPYERALQLREIAEALGGLTMSATIGELIRTFEQVGRVQTNLPGVEVRKFRGEIAIRFDDGERRPFTRDQAAALVALIRSFTEGGASGVAIDLNHNIAVGRRGSAIKVGIEASLARAKTWSPDLAADFADLIERTLDA